MTSPATPLETRNPKTETMLIDGRPAVIGEARNILEAVRAAGIDLPTFCYHSELSVHGACRLCLVDIEGKGIVASCSALPEPGLKIRTQTEQLRRLRRTTIELLLASHRTDCPSCDKAEGCRLQEVARRVGIDEVRFAPEGKYQLIDRSSAAITRDPSKCILCGDCVRMCEEVQGIGALDFANRGSRTIVQPAFGKGMGETECVSCGQCARVCPTGALAPKNDIEALWKALTDPATTVIAQIAPAVRVAIGERFGLAPGAELTGRMTAAMRRLGFAQVYDTGFTADLTVWEEGAEFVRRLRGEGTMPLLTSCCPAWVRYVEQFHPQFLPNLSSCRSPQQMFGALSRSLLPQRLKVDPAKLVVVSVMPCTAKKMEAAREEFRRDGRPEVDLVITTGELARMIDAAGLRLDRIEPEGMDRPFAARSGAGLLFGASGGVSEAVLRYADAVLGDGKRRDAVWEEVRGDAPLRIAQATFGGRTVRVGVVSGLKNAGAALADIKAGRLQVDLLEVMACPGGCINGAGQPCTEDPGARACRTAAMRTADRIEPMHNSADNEGIKQVYVELLGEPGSHTAHDLLHTHYNHRKRIDDLDLILTTGEDTGRLLVSVCLGTSCHLRGSQAMLKTLLDTVDARGLGAQVDIRATFCLEACGSGPNVRIGDQTINKATPETVLAAIEGALAKKKG